MELKHSLNNSHYVFWTEASAADVIIAWLSGFRRIEMFTASQLSSPSYKKEVSNDGSYEEVH